MAASPSITVSQDDLHLPGAPTGIQGNDIAALLGFVYTIAGIVAIIAIIIAGIRYTTSNGDSGKVQAAKDMTFYAIIGLVVVIAAASGTQFIIQMVTK